MDKEKLGLYFSLFNEIGIIAQLTRAMMDARLPDAMTTAHFTVLNHLIRVKDGSTPLAMARAFQIPKTTITHTLSGLEKLKLIEMRANPKDGRSKQVWLTTKGMQWRDQAVVDLAPELLEFSTSLPEKETKELVAKLTRIRITMDKARDADA